MSPGHSLHRLCLPLSRLCRAGRRCYTTDPDQRWELCDVAPCAGCYEGTGADYAGGAVTTVGGRDCMDWALDDPHEHGFNDLPANFCRNPDGEPGPWCYTTDPDQRWELCALPECSEPIVVMVYSEGNVAKYSPSASGSVSVVPGQNYQIKVEVLRNDLGSASERVADIRIDGVSVGSCNPDGGDYDCTYFDCSVQMGAPLVTAASYGVMEFEIDVEGHSWDCDCDTETWECSEEAPRPNSVEGRTPMTAVASADRLGPQPLEAACLSRSHSASACSRMLARTRTHAANSAAFRALYASAPRQSCG